MKKILVSLAALAAMQTAALAGNDRPVTFEQLPAQAQQFIQKHFAGAKLSYAKVETELFDRNYEAVFEDGGKVEFDRSGQWTEIDCRLAPVPLEAVPMQIRAYVAANHTDRKITAIERSGREYEVQLGKGLELTFDRKFNVIDIDD